MLQTHLYIFCVVLTILNVSKYFTFSRNDLSTLKISDLSIARKIVIVPKIKQIWRLGNFVFAYNNKVKVLSFRLFRQSTFRGETDLYHIEEVKVLITSINVCYSQLINRDILGICCLEHFKLNVKCFVSLCEQKHCHIW